MGGSSLPEVSVSSVRSVGISFLPRISQIYTAAPSGLAAWVWQGCHTLLICEHLCSSVGGSSLPEGSVCAFCGNIFSPTDFSLGGYGILPYPRRLLWDILPQNTPNSQNLLLRCPPTDFTDLHRCLGCAVLPRNSQNTQNLAAWVWQGCHTLLHLCASVLICGRLFSARSFCAFRAFCGNLFPPTDFSLGGYGILPYPRHLLWDILPQNTPNSQNLLLRCPPTDFTDLHRYLGCAVLPQNSQNTQNLAAWVWQGCHTHLHL